MKRIGEHINGGTIFWFLDGDDDRPESLHVPILFLQFEVITLLLSRFTPNGKTNHMMAMMC